MFQGDGFLTVVVDGGELGSEGREVFMVYDWAKVPGVTNLYTTDIPQVSRIGYHGKCTSNVRLIQNTKPTPLSLTLTLPFRSTK